MYLSTKQINRLFFALEKKYANLHILLDVYTTFGARASKYKNPVHDVGVTTLYSVDHIQTVLDQTNIKRKAEHSFTSDRLVNQLNAFDRAVFRILFSEKLYRKITVFMSWSFCRNVPFIGQVSSLHHVIMKL